MTGIEQLSARMDRLEGALDRITALLEERLAPPGVVATAIHAADASLVGERDPAQLTHQLSALLVQLGDPETLTALTQLAALSPRLEYAAHFAAAGPELLEEAMELTRARAETLGVSPYELRRRLDGAVDTLLALSEVEQLDTAQRLGALLPHYAPLAEAAGEALRLRTAYEGEAPLKERMVDALLQLSDPETQESLTRIAALAPKLEYAAYFAAAGPELLEEAMELARARLDQAELDSSALKHRLTAITDLLLELSRQEHIETAQTLARSASSLAPIVSAGAAVLQRRAEVEGGEALQARIADALLELSDEETLASLTRIAALAPRLEYAAYFAAAGPELLEEAMELARTWGARQGIAGVDQRVQAGLEALVTLSTPSTLRGLVQVTSIAASISDQPDTTEALQRLASRLPRVERTVTQVERTLELLEVAAQASGLGDIEALQTPVTTGLTLLGRATQPANLEALETVIELAPRLATLAPTLLAQLEGVAPEALAQLVALLTHPNTATLLRTLVDRGPELQLVLDALPVQPHALHALRALNEATAAASQGPPQPVGLVGLLGVLRDPEVQRTLGFGVSLSRHFGARLADAPALEGS